VHATHEKRTGDPEAAFWIDGAGGSPARGNLGTIRLVGALYTAMDSGHSVSVK
jgi:hypothetical protein